MRKNSYPAVLILEEKQDELYYLLKDEEDFEKALASVVTERFNLGYYYGNPEQFEKVIKELNSEAYRKKELGVYADLTQDEIEKLPEALKLEVKEKIARFEKSKTIEIELQEEDLRVARYAQKVSEASPSLPDETHEFVTSKGVTRKTSFARYVMDYRSDYQYESYSLKMFEEI